MSAHNDFDPVFRAMMEQVDLLEKDRNEYLSELEGYHSKLRQHIKAMHRSLDGVVLNLRQDIGRDKSTRSRRIRKIGRMVKRAKFTFAINRRNVRNLGLLIRGYQMSNNRR
jgi:hypothetical protein